MFIQTALVASSLKYIATKSSSWKAPAFMTHFFALIPPMSWTIYSHPLVSQRKFKNVHSRQSIIDRERLSSATTSQYMRDS
jgi:hypothetical protein